ncbi:hypothetical protein CTI14_65325, partial [Methylobacterium radiotolerans]
GLGASLLFSALGISSVVSVVAPYAVSRPGDSPFQQPQRPTSRGIYGPAAAFLGAIGLGASLLFSALGISSVVSVVAPYAVSRPGDSP